MSLFKTPLKSGKVWISLAQMQGILETSKSELTSHTIPDTLRSYH